MTLLVDLVLVLVGAVGTAVVLQREATAQALVLAEFGLAFTVLALVLQAPDVALSLFLVGSTVVPLLVLVAVSKRQESNQQEAQK